MPKYYAGIGSRSTPHEITKIMVSLAQELEEKEYILRVGNHNRIDKAFNSGIINPKHKQVFTSEYIPMDKAKTLASEIHPAWDYCTEFIKNCHGRSVNQVLGEDLLTPIDFVISWTFNGDITGETRTATVLANQHKIPIYNLGYMRILTLAKQKKLIDFILNEGM